MSFKEEWKKRFENFASTENDDAGIAGWSATGLDTRVQYFRRYWTSDAGGGEWLDIGCGAGTYSRLLMAHGKQVVGLDYSYPTLVKAREKQADHPEQSGINWVLGDATALPVPDSSVEGVLSLGVLQALPDSEGLAQELLRVVNRGGEVWIDGLNRACLPHIWIYLKRKFRNKNIHLRYESAGHVKACLLNSGAHRVQIFWMPILPERLHFLQSWAMRLSPLFQLPILSHLFCHSFLIKAIKK